MRAPLPEGEEDQAEGAAIEATVGGSQAAAEEDVEDKCPFDIGVCHKVGSQHTQKTLIKQKCGVEGCTTAFDSGRKWSGSAICLNPLCSTPGRPFFVCNSHETNHKPNQKNTRTLPVSGWKVEQDAAKRDEKKIRRNSGSKSKKNSKNK
eukprot:FR741670.1.p1 GENE.FR741670.1~~FR741670.1.p1  ORF type:complete len:149 (+),score=17.49 FR741670.1:128-574(+)